MTILFKDTHNAFKIKKKKKSITVNQKFKYSYLVSLPRIFQFLCLNVILIKYSHLIELCRSVDCENIL